MKKERKENIVKLYEIDEHLRIVELVRHCGLIVYDYNDGEFEERRIDVDLKELSGNEMCDVFKSFLYRSRIPLKSGATNEFRYVIDFDLFLMRCLRPQNISVSEHLYLVEKKFYDVFACVQVARRYCELLKDSDGSIDISGTGGVIEIK